MNEESEIRQRAYALWEKDERPDGGEEYYWQLALEQFEREGQPGGAGISEAASDVEGQGQAATDSEWPAKGEASRFEQ